MFENVTLRRSTRRQPLTAGELAEALLFYQNAHIIFDYTSLSNIAKAIGVPALTELLSRPNVSAVYCDELLATMTNTIGGVQIHDLVSIHVAVDQKTQKGIKDKTKILEFVLENHGGCSHSDAKKYAKFLREHVPFRSYASDDFVQGGVFAAVRQDALDRAYVYESVRENLRSLIPSCGPLPRFRFDVIKLDEGFAVDTDLDFSHLNSLLPRSDPEALKIGPASLLDIIFMARADLTLAAHYQSELHTWSLVSQIMRLRYSSLLERIGHGLEEVAMFQQMVFDEGRTIREAIDGR
jgi:hypothetical protein